jgi:glycosyltransferase involved in cell wall biosynthesis
MSPNRKCLFIGDGVVSTGFARMNHAYVDGLLAADFDVHMLAINYSGDPHPCPYPIYPAARAGYGRVNDDAFGVRRTADLVSSLKPDVICITQDPWNFRNYLIQIRGIDKTVPIVGSVAVDGKNCLGSHLNDFEVEFEDGSKLNYRGLETAIFWTQFGLSEARLGGYIGDAAVIPLGVNLDLYKPHGQRQSRKRLGIPDRMLDSFCVGFVGRNQPRKRIDSLIAMFAEWVHTHDIQDTLLLLHVAPTGDRGWDLKQLGMYYGLKERMLLFVPEVGAGIAESDMPYVYSSFDVFATASQNEGWNLPQMEAMACGVPTICPDWAAMSEWPEDAALKIPCSDIAHTPNFINVVGGVVDRKQFINGLNNLYHYRELREALSARGLALVNRPCFRWENIGAEFAKIVEDAIRKSGNRDYLSLVSEQVEPEQAEVA